jgi:hypothetical protein
MNTNWTQPVTVAARNSANESDESRSCAPTWADVLDELGSSFEPVRAILNGSRACLSIVPSRGLSWLPFETNWFVGCSETSCFREALLTIALERLSRVLRAVWPLRLSVRAIACLHEDGIV